MSAPLPVAQSPPSAPPWLPTPVNAPSSEKSFQTGEPQENALFNAQLDKFTKNVERAADRLADKFSQTTVLMNVLLDATVCLVKLLMKRLNVVFQ